MQKGMQLDLSGAANWFDTYKSRQTGALTNSWLNGFLMGYPQEVNAAIQAGGFDNDEYRSKLEKLENERLELKKDFPKTYMSGEVMGAVTSPAMLVGSGIYNTIMRSVKNFPAFVRALTGGTTLAAEGAGYGAITSAGDARPGERGEAAQFGAMLGSILGLTGGVGGYVLGKGIKGGTKLLKKLRNWFKSNDFENLGKKVIAELQYYAKKDKKSIDELLLDVANNKVPIIDMSPNMRQFAAMLQIRSQGADSVLKRATTFRADEMTRNLDQNLKSDLAQKPNLSIEPFTPPLERRTPNFEVGKDGKINYTEEQPIMLGANSTARINPNNMETTVRELNQDLQNYISEAYRRAGNPTASGNLSEQILQNITLARGLTSEINNTVRIATKNPDNLLKVEKNGKISLTRTPNLEEAEIIRKKLGSKGDVPLGMTANIDEKSYINLSNEIRDQVDIQSPMTKTARDTSAIGKLAQDAFAETKNLFGKTNFDKFLDNREIILKRAENLGDDAVELVNKYFQYGLQNELNKKLSASTRQSFIKSLNDPKSKENKLLQALYPPDALEKMLKNLGIASDAILSKDRIIGYSAAKDMKGSESLDAAVNQMRDTAQAVRQSNISTIVIDKTAAAIKALFGSGKVTDEQYKLMAEFITQRRPEVAERLLKGKFNPMVDGRELSAIHRYLSSPVAGALGTTKAVTPGIMER
tara:strand:- start:1960 stop:4056 length:2097 start_codon:yes stop_codon:yes gene_type:complete